MKYSSKYSYIYLTVEMSNDYSNISNFEFNIKQHFILKFIEDPKKRFPYIIKGSLVIAWTDSKNSLITLSDTNKFWYITSNPGMAMTYSEFDDIGIDSQFKLLA